MGEEGYDEILSMWQEDTREAFGELNQTISNIRREGLSAKQRDEYDRSAAAVAALIADSSNGVHNSPFAGTIIEQSAQILERLAGEQ